MEIFQEIGNLQENYKKLKKQKKFTKKMICDLVIPFRDKYNLTDIQALQIARDELSINKINLIIGGE
jgi:hypothetical protein